MDKKILITGANGFIGKNLVAELKNRGYTNLCLYDIDTLEDKLSDFTDNVDFVFHLAGVNRPEKQEDFMRGNFGFTLKLLDYLRHNNSTAPILMTSSIQADMDNPYGESKRAGEELIFNFSQERGITSYIYRLPNVFGKWCRPNYNSAVATFCHNIANDIKIEITDNERIMNLVYIDDVVKEFMNALNNNANKLNKFCYVPTEYNIKLVKIAELLHDFKESRNNLKVINQGDEFTKKLYATYLSYLPTDKFNYDLKMNIDERGSFTEFLKTVTRGQVSINISKPNVVKGNHWHNTKNEKFLVVYGRGVIRFRNINDDNIIEYYVSGDKLEVVDIPTGYTHNIENLGESDMVTIMWANEVYDKDNPDTYYLEV